jgi:hypothetical protein
MSDFSASNGGAKNAKQGLSYSFLLLLVGLMLLLGWFGLQVFSAGFYPRVIAKGERTFPHGLNTEAGYLVQKHRWNRDGFSVRFWAGSSLDLLLRDRYSELVRVKEQAWLASGRAVLIGIDYILHDSMIDTPGEVWLLYDFERGELRSCGDTSAWFVWSPENRKSRKMSCYELVGVARQLS